MKPFMLILFCWFMVYACAPERNRSQQQPAPLDSIIQDTPETADADVMKAVPESASGDTVVKKVEKQKTEADVLKDVFNLPEIRNSKNMSLRVAERPRAGQNYFVIQAGNQMEDHFATLYWFYVFIRPEYRIMYYDLPSDSVISLDEWRKQNLKDGK